MARKDPYLRDPNIRRAANVQMVAWPALGAALGAGIGGWFDLPIGIAVVIGVVVGYVVAAVILSMYGGRATR